MSTNKETFLGEIRAKLSAGRPNAVDLPSEEATARMRLAAGERPALIEKFVRGAEAAEMVTYRCGDAASLREKMTDLIARLQASRIVLGEDDLVKELELRETIAAIDGVEILSFNDGAASPREAAFAADCGITVADAALAETGSLILRSSARSPLLLSLAPTVHICIVEAQHLVADLLDFLHPESLSDGTVTLVTGPSKTADIEMTLVRGAHGPMAEHVFILE